ncbi:hypothetical protein B0H14DRAFT_3774115 [Mycena olivaceomarginata]|nr:hypothetical protein B0H14DRAFT_3774115 [Mycena olivaceomarginata]
MTHEIWQPRTRNESRDMSVVCWSRIRGICAASEQYNEPGKSQNGGALVEKNLSQASAKRQGLKFGETSFKVVFGPYRPNIHHPQCPHDIFAGGSTQSLIAPDSEKLYSNMRGTSTSPHQESPSGGHRHGRLCQTLMSVTDQYRRADRYRHGHVPTDNPQTCRPHARDSESITSPRFHPNTMDPAFKHILHPFTSTPIDTDLTANTRAIPQNTEAELQWHCPAETPGQNGTDNASCNISQPSVSAGTKHIAGGIGGKGGKGQGLRIPRPLITIKPRSNDKIPELMMKMEDFSEMYCLGENILDLLQRKGFQCPGALLHIYDTQLNTNPHTGEFKVGHIAELRWALKKMAGKEVQEIHVGTTELYGGLGGQGGWSRLVGGEGGIGEDPVVPPGLFRWFTKIEGGTGGKGGTGSKTEASDRAQNVYGGFTLLTWILKMLPSFFGYAAQRNSGGPWLFGTPAYILCTDLISKRRITGGIGGKGGEGIHRGGEGGLSEASKIWVGSTPQFSKIFGGIGGLGGFGGLFGSQGSSTHLRHFVTSLKNENVLRHFDGFLRKLVTSAKIW